MVLWSVLVNQLLSGEGSRHVSSSSRKAPSSSRPAGGLSSSPSRLFTFFFSLRGTLRLRPSRFTSGFRSLQTLQVSDDGLQVVGTQVVRRHAAAGFDPLRVRDPAADVAGRVLKRRGGDGR